MKTAEQKLIEPLIETSETYATTETSLTILLKFILEDKKYECKKMH